MQARQQEETGDGEPLTGPFLKAHVSLYRATLSRLLLMAFHQGLNGDALHAPPYLGPNMPPIVFSNQAWEVVLTFSSTTSTVRSTLEMSQRL